MNATETGDLEVLLGLARDAYDGWAHQSRSPILLARPLALGHPLAWCVAPGRHASLVPVRRTHALACGNQSTAPSPPADSRLQVTPIDSAGPVRISFLSANITPGSVVAGCGTLIEGCAGRLRMTFRLDSAVGRPCALFACLSARDETCGVPVGRDGSVRRAGAGAKRRRCCFGACRSLRNADYAGDDGGGG